MNNDNERGIAILSPFSPWFLALREKLPLTYQQKQPVRHGVLIDGALVLRRIGRVACHGFDCGRPAVEGVGVLRCFALVGVAPV